MDDTQPLQIVSVTTTLGSLAHARALAGRVLAQRLAACVPIEEGVLSLDRWRGDLCEDVEVRLTLKTLPGCLPALQSLFAAHHPHRLPQFVAVPAAASPVYAAWVGGEVQDAEGAS